MTPELQSTSPESTHTSTAVSGSAVVTVNELVVMMLFAAKIAAPRPVITEGVSATFDCMVRVEPSPSFAVAVTTAVAAVPPVTAPDAQVSALPSLSKYAIVALPVTRDGVVPALALPVAGQRHGVAVSRSA
ncbi:MAG: hypothetical protein NVV70_04135 [Cellulomonas sp.]|nr:hypothetical protein [Cellulomonas sp.]MCR6647355.1 hypothetical protein [Cellulomonas sp.]